MMDKNMLDLNRAFDYACDRYYLVIYDRGHSGYEQNVEGLLLNYTSDNIILLSDKGIYHIKYRDVVFMKPIDIEPRMDKFSEGFKELLKFLKRED